MRQALRRILAERFHRAAVVRGLTLFLTGASGAACLLAVWLQGITWLGTTLPVAAGMTVSLVLGLALGLSPWAARLWQRCSAVVLFAVCQFTLAAWTVVTPLLLTLLNRLLEEGLIRPDASVVNSAICCLLTLPLLTIPATLAALLGHGLCLERLTFDTAPNVSSKTTSAANTLPFLLCGCVCGIIGLAWGAPFVGLLPGVWGAGSVCAALAMLAIGIFADCSHETGSPSSDLQPRGVTLVALTIPFVIGLILAATERVLDQLAPVSVFTLASDWAAIALGCLCGATALLAAARIGIPQSRVRSFVLLIAAISAGLLPALFPALIRASLWINAHVSREWLSLACRGGLTAVFLGPIFAAWSCWACSSRSTGAKGGSGTTSRCLTVRSLSVASTALGFLIANCFILNQTSPAILIVGCAWLLCGAAAVNAWVSKLHIAHLNRTHFAPSTQPTVITATLIRSRLPLWRAAAAIAGVGFVVCGTCFTQNYEPARSAKVLFATNSFLAYRGGFAEELLPWLDQGRLVSSTVSEQGELTLWTYGPNQFQIRENGIPKGMLSTDPQIFPQYTPELFQAAVPLVLHEAPEKVLVLGLCSGMPVATALQFPVQQVVCLEGERGLVQLVKQQVFPACVQNPLDDDRTAVRVVDPVLGLAAEKQSYDVIVSAADQGALLRSQASYTHEFYQRAVQRLKPNGIFCQRFQFVDVGPEPIRQIAKTLNSVFSSVTALEIAPGELLFLATNDGRGVLRERLLDRLQTAHVQNAFSQMGLDWSVMLNLPAFGPEGLAMFASESRTPINRASASQFTFLMPREVVRWANKTGEVHTATVQRVGRFLDWLTPEEASSKALIRRLAEVTAQRDLLVKHSNQFWAYRASLRDQIQNHPRSLIEQASATEEEKKLHPEDKRRIRYFNALSQAVQTRSSADVQRLLTFQAPYDPLLTFFVHQEAAELLAGSTNQAYAEEFRLRLHSVYFTSPQDRSLRNVLQALKLLREHPEIETDPARRWDHFNSLLQMLQGRWESRIGVPFTESSQMVMGDVNSSLLEAEKCIDVMTDLATEAGLSADQWRARKRVLELRLLRPLQEYYGSIFRHHQQTLQKQKDQAALLNNE